MVLSYSAALPTGDIRTFTSPLSQGGVQCAIGKNSKTLEMESLGHQGGVMLFQTSWQASVVRSRCSTCLLLMYQRSVLQKLAKLLRFAGLIPTYTHEHIPWLGMLFGAYTRLKATTVMVFVLLPRAPKIWYMRRDVVEEQKRQRFRDETPSVSSKSAIVRCYYSAQNCLAPQFIGIMVLW